ncbi:MAG: IS200/IS605 family transposase [Proteobacteria bacterium]|nr:IS200/IS605 family transposase [Pseudomonadota bacterium]
MAQSLSRVILHIVFSTENRLPIINSSIQERLHAYIATIARDLGSYCFKVGGTFDHVHLACTLPRTISQSEFIKKVKITSSKWIKSQGVRRFSWQNGYGVFSIGQSQLESLVQYVSEQENHHKAKPFQEELEEILKRYKIEYNTNYL